jgi:regulatory protein
LNAESLRQLALHYVGKYATTQAKLAGYLTRKIRERGWDDERSADIAGLTAQFTSLGYINDAQFAEARSRSFVRRGFGGRRLNEDLRASGTEVQVHVDEPRGRPTPVPDAVVALFEAFEGRALK